MKNITQALIKFHETGAAAKKSEENPFFKSNYASLDEVIDTVRAEAGKFGLTFTQLVDFENANIQKADVTIYVKTIVLHDSGESFESRTPVLTKDNTDPQKMGSGITYAKRYGLQAAFGLPSEDDDGNSASQEPIKTKGHKKTEAKDEGESW
jgi:hypothetical protein